MTGTDEEAEVVPGLDVARGIVLDGRYRIEDVLGQGGMATVYRAHDEVLERDVAVKLFPPTPDADEVLRHRSEMRVLARLSHPGLVTLHDAGSAYAGGPMQQTYLVMELVPGPTLADLLATGPLAPHHAARMGRQLAEALATVHDAGVVHRDIKPANVLLVGPRDRETEEDALVTGPVVKLADFGIARLSDAARMTVTGTTLGTATYLSPEQAAGTTVGPETDVYALGLVLLECLTGEKAFTGTVVEVAAARLTTSPAIPTALGADWCELLTAMTRRDPAERISMTGAAEHLARMAGETRADPATDVGDGGHDADRPAEDVSTAAIDLSPARDEDEPPTHTRRLSPAAVRERARLDAIPGPAVGKPPVAGPADDGTDETQPPVVPVGPVPDVSGGRPGPRSRWVLALLGVLAVVVAAGAYLARPEAEPPPTVEYPEVDGPLGDAIDDLVRSVTP